MLTPTDFETYKRVRDEKMRAALEAHADWLIENDRRYQEAVADGTVERALRRFTRKDGTVAESWFEPSLHPEEFPKGDDQC